MTELFINRARTCAITGHRVLDKDFSASYLEKILTKVIGAGFDTFLIGMAVGFDIECFKILNKLKQQFTIKIIVKAFANQVVWILPQKNRVD